VLYDERDALRKERESLNDTIDNMKRERREMVKELARLREEKVGTAELDSAVVEAHEKREKEKTGSDGVAKAKEDSTPADG
jgi:predicted  nucleic acid-binding Zn-ribbon protein